MIAQVDPIQGTRITGWWLRLRRLVEEGAGYPRYEWLEHESRLHHALTMALWELQIAYRFELPFDVPGVMGTLVGLLDAAHDEAIKAGRTCPVCKEER